MTQQNDEVFSVTGEGIPATTALPITEKNLEEFKSKLPELLKDVKNIPSLPSTSSSSDVRVDVQWWGVVFVLSDKAAKDVASGAGGISAVAGLITAILAQVPGVNIASGIITAILSLHAAVIGLMNQGKGIYITALWPAILNPALWIPTPR